MYIGRVLFQSKGLYKLISEAGELYAVISGKMRYEAVVASDYPAVGDFVLLDRNNSENGYGIIHKILKRKSMFVRKSAGNTSEEQVVATNIDTVFICMSLNNDFNLRRLERYIILAWDSGATPVVVLTKADLCEDIDSSLSAVSSVTLGAEILLTSSVDEGGLEEIIPYLKPGYTIALIIGSSGVGKSTLINRLIGKDALDTKVIRNDDKGKHTTTRRELYLLPNGGLIIDTPGMREIGMVEGDKGIEKSFENVESYFGKCKFSDCSHTNTI
jgi:ribosome biogenesis GTPase / thiamine phosphate phosphatase